MDSNYITMEEAAELEGIPYKTLAQRISRNKSDFQIITKKPETGGKELVFVSVTSLSKQARSAWKEREKLRQLAELGLDDSEPAELERPWYVDCDLDWYMETYPKNYNKAVDLVSIVRGFLQYSESGRSEYAEEYAQKYLGKGQRTLYRYTKAYLEASAWVNRIEKEQGVCLEYIKVLALARKPKEKGLFPSIRPEVKQAIKNIWFNETFASNLGTKEMVYEKLQQLAGINKGMKIPSYPTVGRYINYLMEDENLANAWYLASNGLRAYKNQRMVKASRDTRSLRVMEVVMGDEHTFDCWVAYRFPNGNVREIRPKLVAWVDTRSRIIMGDVICKDPNSDILKQSLLKMILSDPGGVPRYLYIDNGKDYTSDTMGGHNRKDRSGKTSAEVEAYQPDAADGDEDNSPAKLAFDNETKGFYKSIGIEDYHRALPYEPWSKSQIERFFGGVCERFTKWLTSYTGTLTGSKTQYKRDKDVRAMLERGELLTMEEFYEKWHEWLITKYYTREHSGLVKAGETYKTPIQVWENEERYFKAAPPKSYLTMLMMKSRNVHVYNVGIRMNGYEYRADELCDYIGRKVDVKYDPEDMAVLYVFDKNGKKICEAYSQELLQIAPKVPQAALEKHKKMQNSQIHRDRERNREANVPFEEMVEGYVGFNPAAGGIDLMVGAKPEKQKKGKVIQMPEDRTYREGFRPGQRERAEEDESDYFTRQAENALQKLRAMNE